MLGSNRITKNFLKINRISEHDLTQRITNTLATILAVQTRPVILINVTILRSGGRPLRD